MVLALTSCATAGDDNGLGEVYGESDAAAAASLRGFCRGTKMNANHEGII